MLDLTIETGTSAVENWRFELDLGPYLLKIADNHREVAQAIELRSRVFRSDFGVDCDPDDPYWDWSELDDSAAHLIVHSRATGEVVGTYRMVLSDSKLGFYSQTEFELSQFVSLPGLKLELSRACVDPASRTGAVMALLWKGLVEAMRRSRARYLFGCSSLLTQDAGAVAWVMRELAAGGLLCPEYGVRELPGFELGDTRGPAEPAIFCERIGLPPLLRLYLKAGARVAPRAALDRQFKCVDLLTILDVGLLNPALARKYGLAP